MFSEVWCGDSKIHNYEKLGYHKEGFIYLVRAGKSDEYFPGEMSSISKRKSRGYIIIRAGSFRKVVFLWKRIFSSII